MAHMPGHPATNTFFDFNPSWWGDVLEQHEPTQYYSSPTGLGFAGGSPRQQRYFQDAYPGVLQDYYGAAGTSMRQGEAPTSFMDYLETNPWTKKYSSLPPSARGATGAGANPRTRRLFNY